MTTRVWTNGTGLAISAANLNSLEDDMDRALGVPDAALATRVVAGATKTALDGAYGGKVAKGELVINVRDYGAKGDGVADDSAAIQAALNAVPLRGVVIFPYGTYRIITGLTSATSDVRFRSDGGRILGDTADMTMLTVNGARTRINMHLDGNNKAAFGLSIKAGGCEVRDGTYENFRSDTAGSQAILVNTLDGIMIERNLIRNVYALSDGVSGNNIGAARAILILGNAAVTADNVIRDNRIQNITGEEGDAIQLIFGSAPYASGRGVITDNVFDTVSRRAVKIQASDCEVSRNTYRHSSATPPSYPAALIDIVQGNRCTVSGNTLDATYFMGIQASGPAGNRVSDITIANNVVRAANNNVGVYAEEITSSRISGNEITGGTQGMSLLSVTDTVITENIFRSTSANTGNGLRALGTCARLAISRNVAFGTGRTWFIQNDSPGSVVEDNHARFSSGTGGCVRHTDTAAGTLYRGNTAQPNGAGVYNANYTDVAVSLSKGNSATGGGDMWWSTAIPSTEQPTQTHKKGDVALNAAPAASSNVGWVCITNGTPGVWKTFGTVSA